MFPLTFHQHRWTSCWDCVSTEKYGVPKVFRCYWDEVWDFLRALEMRRCLVRRVHPLSLAPHYQLPWSSNSSRGCLLVYRCNGSPVIHENHVYITYSSFSRIAKSKQNYTIKTTRTEFHRNVLYSKRMKNLYGNF